MGTGGKVMCTACRGTGVVSGDYRDSGCTNCGGSGDTGNSPDAIWGHQKNTLRKGTGMMWVPDVEAHEEQMRQSRKAARARKSADEAYYRNHPGG